jgi:hypothetical protein
VPDVVGGDRLDRDPAGQRAFAVADGHRTRNLRGHDCAGNDPRRILADHAERGRIQVVLVLVGDQNNIGFRQATVVGDLAGGIDVHHHAPRCKDQAAVTEKGDLQIPRRAGQPVPFERRRRGRNVRGQQRHQYPERPAQDGSKQLLDCHSLDLRDCPLLLELGQGHACSADHCRRPRMGVKRPTPSAIRFQFAPEAAPMSAP